METEVKELVTRLALARYMLVYCKSDVEVYRIGEPPRPELWWFPEGEREKVKERVAALGERARRRRRQEVG